MSSCECGLFKRSAKLAQRRGLGSLPAECPQVRNCDGTSCAFIPVTEVQDPADIAGESALLQVEGWVKTQQLQKRVDNGNAFQIRGAERALAVVLFNRQQTKV